MQYFQKKTANPLSDKIHIIFIILYVCSTLQEPICQTTRHLSFSSSTHCQFRKFQEHKRHHRRKRKYYFKNSFAHRMLFFSPLLSNNNFDMKGLIECHFSLPTLR